ncbi:protein containing DUF99 [mine drainage metagenome]|uniref:Protein containing DUF99 n=2 Tax=mine drainage metagenome TaxID=410659 RepID=T0ZJY1_9ZZZZ
MKKNLRILGIDDSPFLRGDGTCFLVGVVMRLDLYIEGLMTREIHVDGSDAESAVSEMSRTGTGHSCNIIMTNGITFGGFNLIDPLALYEHLDKPVITVTAKSPDLESIRAAIRKYIGNESALKVLDSLAIEEVVLRSGGRLYINRAGISAADARSIIRKTVRQGMIPEPIRMAHLVGRMIKFGYSGKIIPGT